MEKKKKNVRDNLATQGLWVGSKEILPLFLKAYIHDLRKAFFSFLRCEAVRDYNHIIFTIGLLVNVSKQP
jgi:hypothetical protein